MSTYLFVLAMEVFTKLLHNKAKGSQYFQYHPYCERQHLTHLYFANDLMLFVAADIPSIKLIKEGLEEFKMLSSLSINQSKSEVFCANVPSYLQAQIFTILQFRAGKLPMRYLGMPLISGKLSYDNCVPLIEKITAIINS